MPHQAHRFPRRYPHLGQHRPVGVPEAMHVRPASSVIDVGNPRRFQPAPMLFRPGNAAEYPIRVAGVAPCAAQPLGQFDPQRDNVGPLTLGSLGPQLNERAG
ncbi:MAG TPA: hypothetical protein VIL86_09920 [Tepidisphaeraceae bacterium]